MPERAKTTDEHSPKTSIEQIDPSGDVILFVAKKIKLRVSTKVLSIASPVFASMFGPNFAEGQNLNAISPPVIELPADHAKSVRLLCLILHYQPVKCLSKPKTFPWVQFAVTADKYGCSRAVVPICRLSIVDATKMEFPDIGIFSERRLLASYILGDPDLFNEASKNVLYDIPPLTTLAMADTEFGTTLMPPNWRLAIERNRHTVHHVFFRKLIEVVAKSTKEDARCWEDLHGKLQETYFSNDEDTYDESKLITILCDDLDVRHLSCSMIKTLVRRAANEYLDEFGSIEKNSITDVLYALNSINDSRGLCLQCIKDGSDGIDGDGMLEDCHHDDGGSA